MVTLTLRPGDQQKLQMALKGLVQKATVNTPVVLAQAGQVGASSCRTKCPVDTGRLRASIGNPTKGGIFQIGKSGILGSATGVMFGTAVEYALAVEKNHKTKSHYMLRGVTTAVPDIVAILTGVMR